ncbi:DNA adenine methylase [Halobacillus locisalis]|uniref:site-specific DNA-methyltransferase (adenine-specific) n=1 Tax=Halobacillus locisalis TaxID=220753 RepID=A0A838CVN1_9BACI|nr:DNA adenine methylase [Halobacillus locisalis]MBA2175973.1 DNA adenine methylase [Halobacillus locisalis]
MPVTDSPLRYPGGKTQLKKFIIDLLDSNSFIDTPKYVEPFAGGAGLALSLLYKEKVSEIHINDYDFNIYSIWYSILNETSKFIKLIEETPIDLENWKRQKEVVMGSEHHNTLDVGFATFFLNRTNVSGIISGGPIGGKSQTGKNKIDCRFTKENLIKKINKISRYKEKIHLTNKNAEDLILNDLSEMNSSDTFIFFDPPYYTQGKKLYTNYFLHEDHVTLGNAIDTLTKFKWITTYDNKDAIKNIYKNYSIRKYSLNYSANHVRKANELLIHSDHVVLPDSNNIIYTD